MKQLGIGLAIVGFILSFWGFAWGRSGYYLSETPALFGVIITGVALLGVGALLLKNASKTAPSRAKLPPPAIMGPFADKNGTSSTMSLTAAVDVAAQPTTEAPPTPEPDARRLEARDPNTAMAVLADLAYEHPELRSTVAANPSAYPGLIDWLSQFNEPAIQSAIQRRSEPC